MKNLDNHSKAIDGLRAFAVIAVLVNHFSNELLTSGYLGVDVFFVISGFVITSSLVNRGEQNPRNFFLNFYKRRIKRLLPALLFCFTITAILISFFSLKPANYISTGLFSIVGLSNIDLYLNSTNYWSDSGHLNPFMHTWSLGVEEQFYFIYPLLLWLFIRGLWNEKNLKKVYFILMIGCVLSAIGFTLIYNKLEMMAYFMIPFRFWEIGFGCVLYLQLKLFLNHKLEQIINSLPLPLLFVLLIAGLFLPRNIAPVNTLLIVFLTGLILLKVKIMEANQLGSGLQLFTNKISIFIGKISYSLYLWHWIIITLSLWTVGIDRYTLPFQLLLIFGFSLFSYYFIEKPCRHISWRSSHRSQFMLSTMSGVALFFMVAINLNPKNNLLYLGNKESKNIMLDNPPTNEVVVPKFSKIRTVGNSHSVHILPMLKSIGENFDVEVINEKYPNYILFPNGDKRHVDKIGEVVNSLEKNDLLVLSSRNRYLYEIPYLGLDGSTWFNHEKIKNSKGFGLDVWLSELDEVIKLSEEKQINVVLFLPNIEFDGPVIKSELCKEQWFRRRSEDCNQVVSKTFLNTRFPKNFYSAVKERATDSSNFFVFDPVPIYCPDSNSKECSINLNGIRLFNDTNHLSKEGALLMRDEFYSFLLKNKII